MRAVIEKQRATSDEMEKASKANLPFKRGMPVPWSTPPGTVAEVVNATVAMSAATREHDSEVLVSHFPPSLMRFLCVVMKISLGVSWFEL